MSASEFGGPTGGGQAPIVVVGVGSLGREVLRKCKARRLTAQLMIATDQGVKQFEELRHESSEQNTDWQDQSRKSLLFLAGDLDGGLESLARDLLPERMDDVQLMVAVGAVPPTFGGYSSRRRAIQEVAALTATGATVIVVDSDLTLHGLDPATPIDGYRTANALQITDAIQSVVDLIAVTGEVNVDFADLVMVLRPATAGFYAAGEGSGPDRALAATAEALACVQRFPAGGGGAKGCLISIVGALDLTIDEVVTIASMVQGVAGQDAEIIFGAVHDPGSADAVRVSTLWTGFDAAIPSDEYGLPVLTASHREEPPPPSEPRRPLSHSLKVFLASPSDVAEEREAVRRVIDELNLQHASRWGTHLELVRWETHAVPSMGRAQEVIATSSKLDEIDIFIGILWSRLGTPTGVAESGTVEEFEEAYASWRTRGRPWIAFYFCDRPVQYGGVGGATQFLGVAKFREQFPDKGLYFTFATIQQLEQLIARHVSRIVEQVLDRVAAGDRF
jgi:cell division GTPase FtsZ